MTQPARFDSLSPGASTVEPRLYDALAEWWALLSPPSHYGEEAEDLVPRLMGATINPPRTMLELGCGGGSLAFHLKRHFELTLTDCSAQMLNQSRAVNPTCEHLQGDMRTLRLDRQFDLVLIHDAIMYMTDRDGLRAAMRTAFEHCRPGGAACFMPDCVRETFTARTSHGGEDAPDGRGLQYLEWRWDPDGSDETYLVDYAFLMRSADGAIDVAHDRHEHGLFALDVWLALLQEVGFDAEAQPDPWERHVFVARRPG